MVSNIKERRARTKYSEGLGRSGIGSSYPNDGPDVQGGVPSSAASDMGYFLAI
jgi:hypothetical protein